MSARTTFVSCYGAASESFRADRLKLAFLWFDEILFEDIGDTTREGFLARLPEYDTLSEREKGYLLEAVTPVKERVRLDWQRRAIDTLGEGYPRWGENLENYDFPEPETSEQFAHNALLRKIEGELGVDRFVDGYDIQQAEGRARSAVDAVRVWQLVTENVPCVMQALRDEGDALQAMRSFDRQKDESSPFTLLTTAVPSLLHLSWKNVVELKRKETFGQLRKKMEAIYDASERDMTSALSSLREAERQTTEEIVDRSRPAPGKALIEGVAGNIPVPGNFLSIVLSLKAFITEANKAERYEWFYMLRDLREK